jgi:hypothetical protein
MYFCQRYTDNKLKETGYHFGIGESRFQNCRRAGAKIKGDKKLKRKIERLEIILGL